MTNELKGDIDRFTAYFRKQLIEIQALKTEHAELYQRLLFTSVLDTLAGMAFPNTEYSNRKRFVTFLQKFCLWPDGEKVSLSHLTQLLQKCTETELRELKEWAIVRFNAHPAHSNMLVPIGHDPSLEEVKAHFPGKQKQSINIDGEDIPIAHLQHFHLLYAYRNALVHEFRVPGYGIGIEVDDAPYYHLLRHENAIGEDTGKSVELVYPRQFLHLLCNTGLDQLKLYFFENKLNPYDSRVFGTYWISELNR